MALTVTLDSNVHGWFLPFVLAWIISWNYLYGLFNNSNLNNIKFNVLYLLYYYDHYYKINIRIIARYQYSI